MAHAAETISARRLCTPEQWVRSSGTSHRKNFDNARGSSSQAIAKSDLTHGVSYATSSSATGEPPSDESFDARYRDFARTPILVRFKLASCQQFVASRVAACEHLPSNFRPDNKRVRVISSSKAIRHLLAPR